MFLLETNSIKPITNGLQNTLKSGSYVSFTVSKKIDSNMYKIFLLGKSFNVKSTKVLKEGAVLKAQIHWDRSRLQLKVLEKQSSGLKLPANDFNIPNIKYQIIIEELLKTNLPLDSSYFKILEPFLRKNSKIDQKLVKILLLLIDKGIPVTDSNIKEILSFSSNLNEKNSKNSENPKKSKNINIKSIKENIKKQIKNSDTGNELIKYFNHSVAKHDNWLIIPLNFSFTRPGKGLLKLKLNNSFQITNLVLSISDGKDWEFSLIRTSSGGKIKVSGPNGLPWVKSKPFTKLKEKLYNMGIIFDDNNKEWTLEDGFTEMISGKLKNIDFSV